jgi:hypothetical protein
VAISSGRYKKRPPWQRKCCSRYEREGCHRRPALALQDREQVASAQVGDSACLAVNSHLVDRSRRGLLEGTLRVKRAGPGPVVTTDGTDVVSHAGTALLREPAERVGLRTGLPEAADGLRSRSSGHDPGQVLTDMAVMLADGGETISDIAALTDKPRLHGPVASGITAWRVLAGLDAYQLARSGRRGRRRANERDWPGRDHRPAGAAGVRGWASPWTTSSSTSTPPWSRCVQAGKTRLQTISKAATDSIRCCASWAIPTKPRPGCSAAAELRQDPTGPPPKHGRFSRSGPHLQRPQP